MVGWGVLAVLAYESFQTQGLIEMHVYDIDTCVNQKAVVLSDVETSANPIQSIDLVLSIFDPAYQLRGISILKITELLRHEKNDIPDRLLREILHKLVKDNYLRGILSRSHYLALVLLVVISY